jgi:hypothetical protein
VQNKNHTMKTKFTLSLLCFAFLLFSKAELKAQANVDYSFIVVGCNRVDYTDTSATTGTPYATGLSTANVYQLNRLFTEVSQLNPMPKYLFMAGDVVMGYISDTVELAKQLTYWKQIYTQHPLSKTGIQLVVVPGNHETQDKAAGKKSFIAAERTFVRVMSPYIMGSNGPGIGGPDLLATDQSKLTYSFNSGCDHFIVIDTDPVGHDSRVPYKWIGADIKNARANGARHIFAVGHKPAYSSALKPLDGLEAFIPERDSLWKHMEENQCEAMFSAHEHLWDTIHPHHGKTWQVIAGNGGSRVESTWMGAGQSYFGFTLVNIYKNNQVNVKSIGRDADMTKLSLNEDANPSSVRADFNIGISPIFDHTPVTDQQDKGPFLITSTITDDIGVVSAKLNYYVNGIAQTSITPSVSGNTYTFTIPAQIGFGIIKYNIQANDASSIKFYSTGCEGTFNQFSYGMTSPSSSQSPYVLPSVTDATSTAILTAGDVVGGYKMAGTPDGSGAYDNGDGTFTMLVNHEFGNTAGVARAHGSKGAFVSKWVINKSDLSVVSGSDLIQIIFTWNTSSNSYVEGTTAFARFCSADLAPVSAFYNEVSGLGTKERIFLNGEENGTEGRAFGHISTGVNAGTTYELPALGKFSWENSVAHAGTGDKTVVVGTDDATPGQVYIYIGTKTNSGTDVEKAGLTNGKLFGVAVSGLATESNSSIPTAGTAFTLADLGEVKNINGVTLNTNSNNAGVTTFLRPEDGSWDPSNPKDFYFVTTNGITANSRLWRLRFTDPMNPASGGTIEVMLDGSEGQLMMDNIGIDNSGHILIQEDVGGNPHIGKIWEYTIATDNFKVVAEHDATRFLDGGANFLTQDEEASGIIDAQSILGAGMFLLVDQAHYGISGEVVEGGQILAFYNPATAAANPEVSIEGNSVNIVLGDATPSTGDNTDFGNVNTGTSLTKNFEIKNAGPGMLTITDVKFSGTNGSEFALMSAPTFPLTIQSGSSQTLAVKFTPGTMGAKVAEVNVVNTDINESEFKFSLQGTGVVPTAINTSISSISGINVFPNPASDMATVSVMLEKEAVVSISILDLKGNVVSQTIQKRLVTGQNQVMVNTSELLNGTYFIQISSETGIARIKTVVIH